MNPKFIVGRKWNNPHIYTVVSKDGIEMSVSLNDFIEALCAEIGSPLTIMTNAGLRSRLIDASTKVVSEIKTASKR